MSQNASVASAALAPRQEVEPDPNVPSDYRPGARPVTGWHVLAILLSAFLVIVTANGAMLTAALTSFGGLVTKNSYVAGRSFEANQAAARAEPMAGWDIEAAAGEPTLTLSILDIDGAPVSGAQLRGSLGRPTHARADTVVIFDEVAPGLYSADAPAEPGAWRLMLVSEGSEQARILRFFLRPPRS